MSAARLPKWIEEPRAGWREVIRIPGHHREIMNERRGCNLLVERILRIWYPQSPPDVCRLLVEGQNRLGIDRRHLFEPAAETLCLRVIPSMPDALHTLPQLSDRDDRQIKID